MNTRTLSAANTSYPVCASLGTNINDGGTPSKATPNYLVTKFHYTAIRFHFRLNLKTKNQYLEKVSSRKDLIKAIFYPKIT
jgi:hypothetical protein